MELDQFMEYLSGKPLTEQQKEWLELAKSKSPTGRTRVCVVGDRFNPAFAIGNLIHEDFNKLEDHVTARILKGRDSLEDVGKTGFMGTTFNKVWLDEFDQIQRREIPYEDVILIGRHDSTRFVPTPQISVPEHPADHPTRKREPKGPRGRWGKL